MSHQALWRDGPCEDAYSEGYAHGQADGTDQAIKEAINVIREAADDGDLRSINDVIELLRSL